MVLKYGAFLLIISISVHCEFDVASTINTTQHLQDIERGGVINNIYPQLNPTDGGESIDSRMGGSRPFYFGTILHNISTTSTNNIVSSTPSTNFPPTITNGNTRPFYLGIINKTTDEKFINKTLGSIPSGICTKEVP